MLYKLPIIIGTVSSSITLVFSIILLIKEYKTISFKDINHDERTYLECVIYSTIYLFLMLGYFLMTYLWTGLLLCCSDHDKPSFSFSVYRVIFVFSGICVNSYIFYLLIKHKNIINDYATTTGWILVINMLFIILATSLNKIYKLCCNKENKKESKYEEIE